MRNSRSAFASVFAMAAAMMPGPAQAYSMPTGGFSDPGAYKPTNKGGRRAATMPARPRRTRAQKLRTQARRAKARRE